MGRILVALAFCCTSVAAIAAPAFKGMSLTSFNPTDLASATAQQSIANMKTLGVDTVALNFWWYQSSTTANTMAAASNSSTIASVQSAIDTIHGLGMKVLLKPMLDVSDGTWRAFINPSNPDLWFTNYTNYINTFADIAQSKSVEMLSIGCEMNNMENPVNDQRWINLIDNVRTHYSGPLTYSANWSTAGTSPIDGAQVDGGYNKINWWSHFDASRDDELGIDAYFPVSTSTTPTEAQLQASWSITANQINLWRTQNNLTDKRLLFTETGYASYDGTSKTPYASAGAGIAVDEQEQADAYQALYTVMSQRDWWDGAFWWNWETSPNSDAANSYSPQNKLVQDFLASTYGGTFPALSVSNWNTNSNGTFSTAGNWNSGVPNQNFVAQFSRGAGVSYTVSLSNNRTFDQLRVGSNTVTFQASTTTTARSMTADDWRTSETGRGIVIGVANGDVGVVNVISNGTAVTTMTARAVTIGDAAGATGTLNLSCNSANAFNIIGSSAADAELVVGRAGAGTMNVTNGAHVNVNGAGGNVTLGQEVGSNGMVTVSGSGSTLAVTGTVQVGLAGQATLTVASGGTISASQVIVGALGKLQGDGTITGDIINRGVVSPGLSPTAWTVRNYTQDATGSLLIELASASNYDSLQSTSSGQIDGQLQVSLLNNFLPTVGDSFEVMHFNGGIFGTFAQTTLPALGSGLAWNVNYSGVALQLNVVSVLGGDFNRNGVVDAADYTAWRDTVGQVVTPGTGADSDGNGMIDQADYDFWALHFGERVGSLPGAGSAAAIPEPPAFRLAIFAIGLLCLGGRASSRRWQ